MSLAGQRAHSEQGKVASSSALHGPWEAETGGPTARLSLLTCRCCCWYSASLADSACASARSSSSCVLQGQRRTVCLAPHVPTPLRPRGSRGQGAACTPALHLAAPSSVPVGCRLPPAALAVPISAKQSGSSVEPPALPGTVPTRQWAQPQLRALPLQSRAIICKPGVHGGGTVCPSCTWAAAPSHVPTLPGTSPAPAAALPPRSATKPLSSSHGCPCPGWKLRQREAAPTLLLHPQLSPSGAHSPHGTGPPAPHTHQPILQHGGWRGGAADLGHGRSHTSAGNRREAG